jgi:hypothetical protein
MKQSDIQAIKHANAVWVRNNAKYTAKAINEDSEEKNEPAVEEIVGDRFCNFD